MVCNINLCEKNGLKDIQTAGYNGARTVKIERSKRWRLLPPFSVKVLGIGQTKPGSATATRLGLQRKWGPPRAIYLANSRYFFALMSSTFSNNPELLCRWRFSFFSSTDQVVKTMSRLLFLTLIILCKTRTIKAKLFQEETFFIMISLRGHP